MSFQIPAGVLAQHIAVLGKTGSGKTSTAKLCVEQVVDEGARVCILDPIKSDWWGLISSRDGKRPGLPFQILGGPHGHVPLHNSSGKAIGEIVANGSLPLSILDMADFGPGGQAQFFVEFAPTLIRKMRGVVYLVMEEAHLFAPKERSGIGQENMSIHWAKTMATAGRSKGIRLILVTQRTQALHNALLGSCDTMIAHRMTAPADQEPVIKWLKANVDKSAVETISATISSLPTGEGWICSGESKIFERVRFPRIHTYDNSATPTGDSAVDDVAAAPVDRDKLRAIIGDAVKQAEANDPAALKKRIAELELVIKGKTFETPPAPAEIPQALRQSYYAEGFAKGQQQIVDQLEVYYGSLEHWAKDMPRPPVFKLDEAPRPGRIFNDQQSRASVERLRANGPISPRLKPNGAGVALPPGELATLTALIQFPEGLQRNQLTVLTQYKRSSRDAYIQRLREKEFVETVGDTVRATENGMAALPDAAPLPTGVDLQNHWLARLPEGERKILQALIDAYPRTVEREQLTEITGYARSSRDAYLQRMRAKQLWTEPSRGQVRASEDLFS
jgi:Helicase HerA, central domain